MRKELASFVAATLLASCIPVGGAVAQEDKTEDRLLAAAEGLQMPSSESDSSWYLVSYTGKELPGATTFGEMSGCPRGAIISSDFDETLDRLGEVEPWMDAGQASSARGFRKLERVFDREFGDKTAVYRCENGGPEIEVFFMGADEEGLVGLMTISIET